MDDRLRRVPVGVLAVSADGIVNDINEVARSRTGVAGDVVGASLAEAFPRSVEDSLLLAFEGSSIMETSFEEYYLELEHWLGISVASTDDGIVIYVGDVTERRRCEQSVEKLWIEHKRAAVIETVLSEILTELVGATSRAEIAETIRCSLGETDIYGFAWVGEREIGSDSLTLHVATGDTGETAVAVRDTPGGGMTTTLEECVVETERLQAAQPLVDDFQVPNSVGTVGFADGVQSALAVPFVYDSNVHGMVGIYASGTKASSDQAYTSSEMLGDVASFVVTAIWNRDLLLSNSVAELTFEVGDGPVVSRLNKVLDSTLRLEGAVSHGDDVLPCFVSVEGSTMQAAEGAVVDIAGIDSLRAIRESEPGGSVELTIRGSIPLLVTPSFGGTVRRVNFDSGIGRIVVELSLDGDVRCIADAVSCDYNMEFVAKEKRKCSVTIAHEFRDALRDALTERQRTALQIVCFADYFKSPRGNTAEEVAASFDITGSTLLYHLRAGQRKLLDAYLNESSRSSEAR